MAKGEQTRPDEGNGGSEMELPPAARAGPGEHALTGSYALSFIQRNAREARNYVEKIRVLGTFASVEQFWSLYCCLRRPHELGTFCEYHVFHHGIKPMWEDPANMLGGKVFIRVNKEATDRLWENLILAIAGDQFSAGSDICGAVVSSRYQEDVISIWMKTGENHPSTRSIIEDMQRLLSLPHEKAIQYKAHNESMRDLGSYRRAPVVN